MNKLPESSDDDATKWAVVFDFDKDSCYPSPAISPDGTMNPGLDAQAWTSITDKCRRTEQLGNSNTYYRKASVPKGGTIYSVRMYALYFMKDKTVYGAVEAGHRHDWEFALVWTIGDAMTHVSISHHGKVTTKPKDHVSFEGANAKVVYHKDNLSTGGILILAILLAATARRLKTIWSNGGPLLLLTGTL